MARVAKLLRGWAKARGEPPVEVKRWTSLGYLHDALRDAPAKVLRKRVTGALADLPGSVLHGPAAARLLEKEGVKDAEVLTAVAWHTLGHRELSEMGRALFAADFLEPGRALRPRWRARLRKRMPGDLDGVVREILAARIRNVLDREAPLHWETVDFWNSMVGGSGA